jgi:hypothetical protein
VGFRNSPHQNAFSTNPYPFTTCLGERGWGVDATARGWYSGDYCWGCWMVWATDEGRWMVVRGAVERDARAAHVTAVQGDV